MTKHGGEFVDILAVEVKPERIAPRYEPPFDCPIKMDLPTEAVCEHPIVIWAAFLALEAEPCEKRLGAVKIIAGQYGDEAWMHVDNLA